jgi:hypothetical protein
MTLAMALSVTVLAYSAQVVGVLTVSGPGGSASCNTPITLTATALETGGAPIEGQPIDWAFSQSPSTADTINTPTVTDINGEASTTVRLACVVGQRTVTATGDNVNASAVLSVTSGGLPGTSTSVTGPASNLPIAPILAILAVLAGGGIILRKFALGLR